MKKLLLLGLLGWVLVGLPPDALAQFAPSHRPATVRKTPRANAPERRVKYYTNSRGQRVQSPTASISPPAGACAECRDGTYSFSRSRRGTCSRHGGVKHWL